MHVFCVYRQNKDYFFCNKKIMSSRIGHQYGNEMKMLAFHFLHKLSPKNIHDDDDDRYGTRIHKLQTLVDILSLLEKKYFAKTMISGWVVAKLTVTYDENHGHVMCEDDNADSNVLQVINE